MGYYSFLFICRVFLYCIMNILNLCMCLFFYMPFNSVWECIIGNKLVRLILKLSPVQLKFQINSFSLSWAVCYIFICFWIRNLDHSFCSFSHIFDSLISGIPPALSIAYELKLLQAFSLLFQARKTLLFVLFCFVLFFACFQLEL